MGAIQRIIQCVTVVVLNLGVCICEAEFVQFPGFEPDVTITKSSTEHPTTSTEATSTTITVEKLHSTQQNKTQNVKEKFSCPEEEKPKNIGPYEVPTQRDLVIHMKTRLRKLFNSYHNKAMFFLKDIQEATRATSDIADKCPSDKRDTYKKCVKHVSNQCELITKTMVKSLEYQRYDVAAVTEGLICNMSTMKADPVALIKIITMEEASLEFALPGFLRLLSACSFYCNSSHSKFSLKPIRHMTDQDLVIKHFLTRKNYVQLIKGDNDNSMHFL